MPCHYRYFGLSVASDVAIPEWKPFRRPAQEAAPDVRIKVSRAACHTALEPPEQVEISRDYYRFSVPETACYEVREGREIVVRPALRAGMRDVRLFLLGSAWGALCYQRGLLVLHASVVQVGGHAIAFCGPSGAGKSSTAAWMMARGSPLVSDDLCRVDVDGEKEPLAYPSTPRLKLWREALDALNWTTDGLQRDHTRIDKLHVHSKNRQLSRPLPLRGLYLLEWGAPGIARLRGAQAVRKVVSSATYRGALLEPMGRMAAYWQDCVALVQQVPVRTLTRPRDWSAMGTVLDRIEGVGSGVPGSPPIPLSSPLPHPAEHARDSGRKDRW